MTDLSVAQTILAQLGGRRFIAMTGAKDFVACNNGLNFRIPGVNTKDRVNKVRVVLNPSDTYDVLTYRVRRLDVDHVDTRCDVYADNLQEVFTRMTGLDTHL